MTLPPPDFVASRDLVANLIAEQHPDLSHLSVELFDEGWDNSMYTLGTDLLVRIPRREFGATSILYEQQWLPTLAKLVTLPIPNPVRTGRPSLGYPWSWSIVPRFEGTPGDRMVDFDLPVVAQQLGEFLRSLHVDAPHDAPKNPVRGVALKERESAFVTFCNTAATVVDLAPARRAFARATELRINSRPPQWLHGDLHPGNMLFRDGRLCAVIDFSDVCCGDPATDLAAGWLLFGPTDMPTYLRAYATTDKELLVRTQGWAAFFGVMFVAIGHGDRPPYEQFGFTALETLAAFDASS